MSQKLNSQQKQSRNLAPLLQKKIEFSKKLAYIDIASWAIISLILLIASCATNSFDFIQSFGIVTKAYVILRLGYTAKAGLENFKKISNLTITNTTNTTTNSGNG